MIGANEIKCVIESGLEGSKVCVSTHDGQHFSAEIYAESFVKMTRVEKHQAVYECLRKQFGDNWTDVIHALEIKIVDGDYYE